jgi:hypothetical protein
VIRRAQSSAADVRTAVREFHAGVLQPDTALVVFFCSPEYDLSELAAEMRRVFAGVQTLGCTTAGEIGPAGCRERSITGLSFSSRICVAVSARIPDLQSFEASEGYWLAQDLLRRLESAEPRACSTKTFGLLLTDGLSVREEPVMRALQSAVGEIELVGGSAGDGLHFGSTWVYADGAFHTDSAVLALLTTSLPFKTFKTQHFIATDQRVVVTGADPRRRLVTEIDGRPAAEEYARLIGVGVDGLDAASFAAQPLVVVIDEAAYVRSIQKANPDGSLTLFCAIDEGVVLRTARCGDLAADLEHALAEVCNATGGAQVTIGFDCVLRKLEIEKRGLTDRVETALRRHNVVGFNTYGEQYHGVHVTQTLTGIAIGEPEDG